jgi:hypothetical protein
MSGLVSVAALLESNALIITIVGGATVGLTVVSWVVNDVMSPSPKIQGHAHAGGHGYGHGHGGGPPERDKRKDDPEDWGGDGRWGGGHDPGGYPPVEGEDGSRPIQIDIHLDEVVDRLNRIEAFVAPTWKKRLTDLAKNLFFAFFGLALSVFVAPMLL